nr:hypothetical protein [Stenotrophomonas pavanii]
MSNDNKTLADVQPGGRVRLGDQAERARFEAFLSGNPLIALSAGTAWQVWQAALSAQPSPGGQGGLNYERMFVDACAALAEVSRELGCDPEQGGAEPILAAIAELREALAARQPVGELVAWMTHHDEPMLFPTAAEAAAYCEDDEQPVPLFRSPAQAVDLGQFRAQVAELLRREFDLEVADPDDHRHDDGAREADRIAGTIAALIDSQAVGNG